MRPAERHVQEAQRIEQRLRGMPERFEHGFLGDFGRAGAIGVPAHAVDDREQDCPVRVGDGDSILVFFAVADQAQVRMLDLQGTLRRPSSCRLIRVL